MKLCDNLCRFCLKFTTEDDQVALFEEQNCFENKESNGINWRRIFSFIFYADGLPNQICKFCQSQVVWIAEFYRTVFENDCSLRNALAKEGAKAKTVNDHSDNPGPVSTKDPIKFEGPLAIANVITVDEEQVLNEPGYDYDGTVIEDSQVQVNEMIKPIANDIEGYSAMIQNFKNDQDIEIEDTGDTYESTGSIGGVDEYTSEDTDHFGKTKRKRKAKDRNKDSDCDADYGYENNDSKSNEQFICEICKSSFCNKYNLKRHSKTHDGNHDHDLKCEQCGKCFSTKYMRDVHYGAVHKGYKYKCPLCPVKNTQKSRTVVHIRKMHPNESIVPIKLLENKSNPTNPTKEL